MPTIYIIRPASFGPKLAQGYKCHHSGYMGLSAALVCMGSQLVTSSLLACPPHPLIGPPEPHKTKTSVWLLDSCA
jgi:hypothetical protein